METKETNKINLNRMLRTFLATKGSAAIAVLVIDQVLQLFHDVNTDLTSSGWVAIGVPAIVAALNVIRTELESTAT